MTAMASFKLIAPSNSTDVYLGYSEGSIVFYGIKTLNLMALKALSYSTTSRLISLFKFVVIS